MDDLIDRQAAIDALHMHLMYRMGTDSNKKRLDDWINSLPSAQETHEERTETHACDCISRQAAIDAYGDWYVEEGTEEGFIGTVKQLLEGLPPAQPEQSWIPCGERLPEHGGRYLISALDGINRRITVAPYLPRCKAWTMTGRMAYWKVIAWMPLPEPYREDES